MVVDTTKNVAPSVAAFTEKAATDFASILDRLKEASGAKTDTELAHLMGLRQSSISGAKSKKEIPPSWVILIAKKFNTSTDWLWFGIGSKILGGETTPSLSSAQPQPPPAPPPPDDFKISDMLTKAAEVLESSTPHRMSLASVISSLHQAVQSERLLARIDERMTLLEQNVEELRRENQELKQHKSEQLSQSKAVGA